MKRNNRDTKKGKKSMFRELLETVISAGIIAFIIITFIGQVTVCLLYTSPSPRDRTRSRMPSSA